MEFKKGDIEGVVVMPLKKHLDERGWLSELFRIDELPADDVRPVMSYISYTAPGVQRGPHEHVHQTDYFSFVGPSNFKVCLWDAREASPTKGRRLVIFAGEDSPCSVIVPPGVVHAYKNIGSKNGAVLNFPNRLFMGAGKKEKVDEIRHEETDGSPYRVDE
jgi:dTDP-4-dehydrorhamnose 3,5-epimerase